MLTDTTEWVENFEGGEWQAGSGSGDDASNPTHRGTLPPSIPNRWTVSPNNTNPVTGWSVRSGPTGTQYTGPSGDHTSGGGKYVYLESSHTKPGPAAASLSTFTTPCIQHLTRVSGCRALEFYYHMFGQDIDLLAVNVDTGSDAPVLTSPIYYIQQGEEQTSSN
ncbi:MAG: hypothetical protein U5L96_05615 [Owenweeksia sp.]|nr:hypothetical protein [Owenweeksia sp.]